MCEFESRSAHHFRPCSPTGRGPRLNRGKCGFEARHGYVPVAQSAGGGGFKLRMVRVRISPGTPPSFTHHSRTLVRTARAPADNRVAVGSTPTACTNTRHSDEHTRRVCACPYRRTGVHFAGTCAGKTGAARRRNSCPDAWMCDRSSDRPGLLILSALEAPHRGCESHHVHQFVRVPQSVEGAVREAVKCRFKSDRAHQSMLRYASSEAARLSIA